MNGLSVKLPLSYETGKGYDMNTNYLNMAKQNLKMVILTEPGERIMMPNFGVGVKRRLFENQKTVETIRGAILEQASKYVPYVTITNISIFKDENQNTNFYDNSLNISISFFVKNFGLTDTLNIQIRK